MDFPQLTINTASVPAGGQLDIDQAFFNRALLYKIKVTPSILANTSELIIYKDLARAKILYQTNAFPGVFFDPVKDNAGVITEVNEGLITSYIDFDGTAKLHLRIKNNDAQAKTYTVVITYDELFFMTKLKFWVAMTGLVNGSNKTFTTPTAPNTTYPIMIKSGNALLEEDSTGYGFSRSGSDCTFGASVLAPETGWPAPKVLYVEV